MTVEDTLADQGRRLKFLETEPRLSSFEIGVLKEFANKPRVPGAWETIYPWVTSKTAIAFYSVIIGALTAYLGTPPTVVEKRVDVPVIERPAEKKAAEPVSDGGLPCGPDEETVALLLMS